MNDHIYAELKRRIVLLDYTPGEMLREKDLIEEFGVSRTPVRETLIRLETEGLVRIIPNQGTMVTDVSFQNLKDVFEIRSALLRLAGRLAAERVTQPEIDELRDQIDAMKREADPRTLMRLDMEFHETFNRITKNQTLVKILGVLRNQAVRIWSFIPSTDDYYAQIPADLEKLLEALEARDAESTTEQLECHSKRFVEHVRGQL